MDQPTTFEFCFVRPHDDSLDALRIVAITSSAQTEAEALERLERGISKWTTHTEEGKQAWRDSSGDLNIGDLAAYFDAAGKVEESLSPFLADEGITRVTDVLVRSNIRQIPYDRVLAHPE
jgi:hypothetical protein